MNLEYKTILHSKIEPSGKYQVQVDCSDIAPFFYFNSYPSQAEIEEEVYKWVNNQMALEDDNG